VLMRSPKLTFVISSPDVGDGDNWRNVGCQLLVDTIDGYFKLQMNIYPMIQQTFKQRSSPCNRPCSRIDAFRMRYEHLHTTKCSYPRNRPWMLIGIFPVRCEYYLHIKRKAILITGRGGVFSARYEHHVRIKLKLSL
jgi:hypothetical protein